MSEAARQVPASQSQKPQTFTAKAYAAHGSTTPPSRGRVVFLSEAQDLNCCAVPLF